MLEIVLLYVMCKKMGEQMRAKKRKAIWFQLMLVAMWFGGEIAGAIVAVVINVVTSSGSTPASPSPGFIYISALVGAIVGAVAIFVIAHWTPEAKLVPGFPVMPAQLPPSPLHR